MEQSYDIFLSYTRKQPHSQWVNDVFFPLFVPYVEDALNRKITVFKYDSEIQGGSDWEHIILNSLLQSRIMVPILSPSYFMSEWCRKEFQVFHYRQIKQGFMTKQNPYGLIVPVRINDGDFFPNCVKKIQSLDCRNYFRIGEGFKTTARYIELQDKLIVWANEVAQAIQKSKEISVQLANLDWIKDSQNEIHLSTNIKNQKPRL